MSPLQLNQVTSVFANGGKLITPTLTHNKSSKIVRENLGKAENIAIVQEGMYQNTVGDGNVSYLFQSFPIKTAGKTGVLRAVEKTILIPGTGYAPYDQPKLAVTVMVERAGHGSEVSAPVENIFKWYFKLMDETTLSS